MFELGKLHQGLSYEQYAEQTGVRSSYLKSFKRSPAHFKHSQDNPTRESPAMSLGKVVHGFIEQGDSFKDNYLVEPKFVGYTLKGEESTNCKESREKKAAWYSSLNKNQTVVTQDQQDLIVGILKAIGKHGTLKKLLKNGMRESSGWVKDPKTGLVLKFRPDFISEEEFIVDFKTTKDARFQSFRSDVFSDKGYFYILQAAHYCYCAKLMGLKRSNFFTYIAIENTAPHGIMIYNLTEDQIENGEQWRAHLMNRYVECLNKNEWPGYSEEALIMNAPEYFTGPFEEIL